MKFSGGPHSYDKGGQFSALYNYGQGSGLDFAASGKSFPILAMASGQVIAADCSISDPNFGCIVAIRHDVGGSILIYAHLDAASHDFIQLANRLDYEDVVWVNQGDPIGNAGKTGSGAAGSIHLHIELRKDYFPGEKAPLVWGEPIGWETIYDGGDIDGYFIWGYAKGATYGPGSLMYNYDGVATRGNFPGEVHNFRFIDNPTSNEDDVTTKVGEVFYNNYILSGKCGGTWYDCEQNSEDPNTQFARVSLGGQLSPQSYTIPDEFQGPSVNDHGSLNSSNKTNRVIVNDNSTFLVDLSLPDSTIVPPNRPLTKTWRIQNTGSTTWGSGYQMVFMRGDQLGAPVTINLSSASPGQTVDLSVPLTTPSGNGDYAGYWRLRNPQGTYFGSELWVKLSVRAASSHISLLSADPPPPADTDKVRIRTRVDNFPNFRALRIQVDGQVLCEIGTPEAACDWNTAGFSAGAHSVAIEVADQTDLTWSRTEVRSLVYTLTGSGASSNHVPDRPTLVSPYDWFVYNTGNTAHLCAQVNGDPDGDAITGYYFDVSGAELWNSGWVGTSCVTTMGMGPHSYGWRVKVRDSKGGESAWSYIWHYTLVNPTLFINQLYFEPQDGNSERVKIRACTSGQAGIGITLKVSVNEANDGSGNGRWNVLYELGVPCFNDVDAPIWDTLRYSDGPHRVRVEAHGLNTGWDGAAVREEVYTLPHRRPAGPNLVAPVPQSKNNREAVYLNNHVVQFKWESTLRSDSYTLHVSTNPNPQADPNPIFHQTFGAGITQQTVNFAQDYPVLYWQVTTLGEVGSSSSTDQLFGIDTVLPSCTIDLLSDVVFENVFQVSWIESDDVSGPRSADVQYLDSERGDWQDWQSSVPNAKLYDLFTGQAGHMYRFRCRALDQAGNLGNYSSPSAPIKVDPAARPGEVWWNSWYGQKRGITVLNTMPSRDLPTGYPVRLLFTAGTTPSASTIYDASLTTPKCNDLRIVYNNTTQLDRFVPVCQGDRVEIWFKTQAVVGAGAVDNSSYRLYYGNSSAGAPPADQKNVWPPLADGNTVGLWFFSEGSGSWVADSSGSGNNGTNIGVLTWMDGKFGKALTSPYPGENARGVFVPGSSSLGSNAFTLDFFAKRSDTGGGYIAGQGEIGSNQERFRLRVEGMGSIRFQIDPYTGGASDVWAQNGCLQDMDWHHIAVTFDGNRAGSIYCDGVLQGTGQYNDAGISNLNLNLYLGSDFTPEARFHGSIDQVRFSNIVRTSFPHAVYAAVNSEPALAAGDIIHPTVQGSPDLAVVGLTSYPNPAGGLLVEVQVHNQEPVATGNGFYTDLYVNHLPTGAGDYTGSLRFWVSDPTPAGATVTLTSLVQDLAGIGLQSTLAGEERSWTLYAQTDSTGALTETNKANNITTTGIDICLAAEDAYEGSDGTASGAVLLNDSQLHNFDRMGDEDWVKITALQGGIYRIITSSLSLNADTYLFLYDRDGTTLLASNDDYNGTLASQIVWTAPVDGTYYVLVRQWNPNSAGCGTGYTLGTGGNSVYLPLIRR